MFKFVLYRAVETTANIFCSLQAPAVAKCQEAIEDYNRRAKPVWKSRDRGFLDRQQACQVILDDIFSRFCDLPDIEDTQPVPTSVVKRLDTLFGQHYRSHEVCLLFGHTGEDALEVQDRYGLSVAELLRQTCPKQEARAHLFLRKMYGRGAPLPILTVRSAAAIWRVCNSHYYQRQISMVSSGVRPLSILTNSHFSFTPGSSLSRRS